ncbi:MAG TPA: hypothetical protein VGT78_10250 [Rhizomicrobium sp.]|nr:hypothetical protein [Rhizomicrobium sp.]
MILPSLAFAADSTSTGSNILNGQVDFNISLSKVNVDVQNAGGNAVGQSVAASNVLDVTTMQDTSVNNQQYSSSSLIESDLNAHASNIGGSAQYTSQSVCNSANVSTDPTTTNVYSNQECRAQDPTSTLNAGISNIAGDTSLATSAIGNTFAEDTNAPNAPVETYQINSSATYSALNASVANIGGTATTTSAAIGNNAQIVHYGTN